MANTICLSGPPFSITGNQSFIGQHVGFQLSFDSSAEQDTVKAYDWYLDGNLIIDQNQPGFNATLSCGMHTIGARVLTDDGWSGVKTIGFQNCRPAVSTIISGPDSVDEHAIGTYAVIATFSDDTSADVTDEYTLTSTDGTFSAGVFTPGANTSSVASRQATLTASKPGFADVTRQITITDATVQQYDQDPGILVVDLFNNTTLNVIGLVDNAEVANNHVAAYAGNNFVPAGSQPQDALVLASDAIPQPTLNWRFQFNIAKLLTDYPSSPSFTFYVKGRGASAGPLSGAFILKTFASQMTMVNSGGANIPSVTGSNLNTITNFAGNVAAGANGSYAEADLTTILKFIYDVANKSLSCTTTP